jgi:hypothetical protein
MSFSPYRLAKGLLPGLKLREMIWEIEFHRVASPFAIDWRQGTSCRARLSAEDLTDTQADFIADPFLCRSESGWQLFFEALERSSGLGILCLAESRDLVQWRYRGTVLREPFHLSYPGVFAWEDGHYMVPESAAAREVRLYVADSYPTQWRYQSTLLEGGHRDPSLFRKDGLWWMFTMTEPEQGGNLRLYHSEQLEGPWHEHARSPLIRNNPHITRPGGRVLEVDGRFYRIAQDTYPHYGLQLFAFEIIALTKDDFEERQIGQGPILKGARRGFLADQVHHLDAKRLSDEDWIAVIDRGRRFFRPRISRQR